MDDIKIEKWLNYEIRFVEHNGEWWAVAKDISVALGYRDAHNMTRIIDTKDKDTHKVSTLGGIQELSIISEFGIYDAVFNSKKKEAKEFKRWIYDIIKSLRQATGLEGFQIFRMLDKEHQKEMMAVLQTNLDNPNKISYIKANTIANKAVSKMFGYNKSIKKEDMSPEMLVKRQVILNDTVELMTVKEKYGIDLSVSKNIYNKHTN